jgi:tRNA A37 threonylcarbamoyladenosine dehydratase
MNWDRVERLLGAHSLEHLRGKKVALIGLGSGGGFVATGLAMSAVANFVLIDDDVLEAHNVVRHVGDLRDVGRPKAELVADLILARNAEASVQVIVSRVEDHTAALDGIDLVICAADGE